MSHIARILSQEDLEHMLRLRLYLGVILGIVAAGGAAIARAWVDPQPTIGRPEILKQTSTETVARIPTLRGKGRVVCEIHINHATRTWWLSC